MGVFAGLALWLVPHPGSEAAHILHREMDSLISDHFLDSPSFKCHATLISGLNNTDHGTIPDIISTTQTAIETWRAQHQPPPPSPTISASLKDVTTRGSYFQCILLAINTHNDRLISLNQHMRDAFKLHDQPAFFPHISLLYADLTAHQAHTHIRDMERRGVFTRVEQPDPNGSDINFAGLTQVDFLELQLYDCNGSPETWKPLHTFRLCP